MGKQSGIDLMWARIREIVGDFASVSSPEAALDLADTVFRESRHWIDLHSPEIPTQQSVRKLDEIAFLWVPAFLRALDACVSVERHLAEHPDPSLAARTAEVLDQARALLAEHHAPGVQFRDVKRGQA